MQTKVKALEYYKNFGLYDSRHRDRRLAVIGSAYGEEKDVSAVAATAGWQAQLRRIRDGLTERFAAFLTAQEACVLASLLFGGHYEELAPELVESFAVTGLIHILSVSGSHVVLLFAVIRILGGAAGLRPLPQFAVAALAVFVYSALAEFTGPVVRAALMGSLCALSTVVKREYGGIHSLSLAVFVMTLADPYLLFDLSFRLSCGAAAGIILFRPRLLPFCRFLPSAAAAALAVCLSAQILLVPLLLAEFSSLPVYSFLANVTVGTVLDAVIVLGLLAAAAAYVLPVAATPLLWLIKILLNAAVGANYVIASLPGSRHTTSSLPLFLRRRIGNGCCWQAACCCSLFRWQPGRRKGSARYMFLTSAVIGPHVGLMLKETPRCGIIEAGGAVPFEARPFWRRPFGMPAFFSFGSCMSAALKRSGRRRSWAVHSPVRRSGFTSGPN